MARAKLYWGELAERLYLERAKRGWSAEYVAERAGLGSKDTVLKAELGQRKPNPATIVKFEQAYRDTVKEGELLRLLLHGKDSGDPPPSGEQLREWVRQNRAEATRMLLEELESDRRANGGS